MTHSHLRQMKHLNITYIFLLFLTSCSYYDLIEQDCSENRENIISIAGSIDQEAVTRVNDDGFANGDVMGVYIVDYEGNIPGILKNKGNRADNVGFTFDEAGYRWNSAHDIYWKDRHTRIDVYGYYPYSNPNSVSDYSFEVKSNQSKACNEGSMCDYEASDFLWGQVCGVEPTSNTIRLPLSHRMANARVTLIEGTGFSPDEWKQLNKQVVVSNTIVNSTIDLSTGTVTVDDQHEPTSIIPSNRGDEWRAIVVPQTIKAGTSLFNISIGGLPYRFAKKEDFEYVSGKMSNFGIKVDKKTPTGDYTLTLISESITKWENDLISHDAVSREYIIVNSTEGDLKECIRLNGNNPRQIRNLKITGTLNALDFYFMRDSMPSLQALNLKEVRIMPHAQDERCEVACKADQIPVDAFYTLASHSGKASLTNIILPDVLKSIGCRAFYGCRNLTGSLVIPEGVVDIQRGAFTGCKSLTGSLSLPSTLRYIGNYQSDDGKIEFDETKDEGTDYYHGVFDGCGFTCELIIPDGVELIRGYAFANCTGLYGDLRLPHKLKRFGKSAFSNCKNLRGSLQIPSSITDIPENTFYRCGFDGSLVLHDGIISIGTNAFYGCHFKGELSLPKNLTVINENVFYGCDFSGKLNLPKSLISIGEKAFAYNWRLSGNVEFSEGLITIGEGAFAHCRGLEGLVFPKSLENIRSDSQNEYDGGAFQGCYSIGSIVSKSEIPPYVQSGAFTGVPKDNFTLEVPEQSIIQYQSTIGWRDFKRIAAHHELVCRPAVACALSSRHQQTLVIDAESDWEVESKPEWCELSSNSGSKKSEITLTIKAFADNDGSREGEVVFRLKGKDYHHSCHVKQYGYQYSEDEYLTLQSCAGERNRGINIVILGDGYDAKDIASGEYLNDMKEQIENFFAIEPYTTYRQYFNVYTAFPLSTESGVGTINTIRYNKFGTTFTGGVGLRCDYDAVFEYALNAPTVGKSNIDKTLIIIVPNSTDYGGICQMWESGAAIAFCPKSTYEYPFDSRGIIQHEAGGHGFGKLADEYIYHNEFIDACKCTCCGHVSDILYCKSLGWYDNIDITGKLHEVGWNYLITHPRYCDIVDIYEGAYMHSRGVFRSEQNSCMNNDIPYYSTVSRESIVRRIKSYVGEDFKFQEFVDNDKVAIDNFTRSRYAKFNTVKEANFSPVIHKGSPLKNSTKKSYKLKTR